MLSAFVLANVFDDLDPEAIADSFRSLTDAEWLALGLGWMAMITAQGFQTAALVPKLPVRQGIQAYLGPAAVSSVIPGPSDLPVRYSMFMSWGRSATEAGTAVGANGIFSIGSKLILPAIAGLAIVIGDIPLEGFTSIIVTAAAFLGILLIFLVVVLGSARRTAALGRFLDRVWRTILRLLRKHPADRELADALVGQRAEAAELLRHQWPVATWATVLQIGTRCALLVMCIRFAGVPESAAGWSAIFAVFALVQGLTAVPITAGNVGVTELAYIGMLTPIAGTEWVNEITAGVMIFRILTWLLIIPVGFATLGYWRFKQRGRQAAIS